MFHEESRLRESLLVFRVDLIRFQNESFAKLRLNPEVFCKGCKIADCLPELVYACKYA